MDAGCVVVRQYHRDKVGSQISSKIAKASEKMSWKRESPHGFSQGNGPEGTY